MNKIIILLLATFIIVVTASYVSIASEENSQHPDATTQITEGQTLSLIDKKPKYICPMHADIIDHTDSNCPICGMKLVAVKASDIAESAAVSIPDSMQKNVSLAVSSVTRDNLWRYIETSGSVEYNANSMLNIHSKASGWIERLNVTTQGERVKKGQLLYEIYSPDLVAAQDYYLGIFKSKAKVNQRLLDRAYRRLKALGLTDDLITKIGERGDSIDYLPFYAPFDGIVTSMDVREGAHLKPSTRIMTLTKTSQVWLLVNVFEHQIDWVEVGKWAEVDLPSVSLYELEAQIEHIYPELDPKTRTVSVHLSLNNPDNKIKKNMLANVRIYGGAKKDVLNIPVDALIRTENSNRVIVKTGQHKFSPRNVTTGITAQGKVEILSGLEEGEKVVTSGQFLIDSEANIRAAIANMENNEAHQIAIGEE